MDPFSILGGVFNVLNDGLGVIQAVMKFLDSASSLGSSAVGF